ncbi:MAG: hypothetical protein L6461_21530 [Anaerolineae bacterium]|nr:hypothetical protein [Anaerolineae bacterium]
MKCDKKQHVFLWSDRSTSPEPPDRATCQCGALTYYRNKPLNEAYCTCPICIPGTKGNYQFGKPRVTTAISAALM